MKIIDLTISVSAGRAVPTRQLVRGEVLRSIHCNQRMAAQAGQRRQDVGPLNRSQNFIEHSVKARRFDVVEYGSDVIVARNALHSQQGLAIRAPVSDPFANLTLVRQKRRTLHQERRKPRQPDVPHRELRVPPLPLVRQARAGPSDTIDQIIEKAHRIVESELEPKHKSFLVKFGSNAKMRIAGAAYDGFPDRKIVNSIVFVAGAIASFRRKANEPSGVRRD